MSSLTRHFPVTTDGARIISLDNSICCNGTNVEFNSTVFLLQQMEVIHSLSTALSVVTGQMSSSARHLSCHNRWSCQISLDSAICCNRTNVELGSTHYFIVFYIAFPLADAARWVFLSLNTRDLQNSGMDQNVHMNNLEYKGLLTNFYLVLWWPLRGSGGSAPPCNGKGPGSILG